ncbi:hypothetical protein [Cerasicoccus fimbriatus]|uniref:hypothetical protein n=1 Tax=Cerasicoccus fimbriatus TaxID=3014554 RepID=UPI0022B40739|nr:hypothetical protein [Cerasicoccus sp. TK19100]
MKNFVKHISFLVSEKLADVRYFLRHRLKNRFRSLKGFAAYQGKEYNEWRQSAEARKKTAKRERWAARANAKDRTKLTFKEFGEWVVAVVTSPVRFLRWLFRKLNHLRQLSFKEACLEIWYGYRGLIAWLLNRLQGLFFRWLTAPLWLRVISVLVILCGLVGAASLPWGIKAAKGYRSDVIFAEAKQLQDDGRTVEAYTKARAAALLNRDNAELLAMTTELAKEARNPELVWWSEQAAKANGYDAESLAELIENACLYRRIRVAARFYQMFAQQFPEHELLVDSRVRLLMAQGREAEAYHLAQDAFAAGNQSPAVHQLVLQLMWTDVDPENRPQLIQYIDENLERNDEISQGILGMALAKPAPLEGEGMDAARLLAAAKAHPKLTPTEVAMHYCRAYELGGISREEAVQGVYGAIDWSSEDSWEDAYEIISAFGLYEILDNADLQSAMARDEQLTELYLEGLAANGKYEKLAELLSGENQSIQLAPMNRAFWLSVMSAKEGDADGFQENLVRALEFSEVTDWPRLQRAAKFALGEQWRAEFYRESMRHYPHAPQIINGYIQELYQQGQGETLAKVLPQISLEALSKAPYLQAPVIYLKALYGQDLPLCRYYAEELVSRFPDRPDNYILLAYVYLQSGAEAEARKIGSSIPVNVSLREQNAYLALCYAAIMGDWNLLGDQEFPLPLEQETIRRGRIQNSGEG